MPSEAETIKTPCVWELNAISFDLLFPVNLLSPFVLLSQSLSPIEHNGPGLEYKVSYRRQGTAEDWTEHMVKRHSFLVKNTPTFILYEIKIQAKNHAGWGPDPKIITAYSGEDCK